MLRLARLISSKPRGWHQHQIVSQRVIQRWFRYIDVWPLRSRETETKWTKFRRLPLKCIVVNGNPCSVKYCSNLFARIQLTICQHASINLNNGLRRSMICTIDNVAYKRMCNWVRWANGRWYYECLGMKNLQWHSQHAGNNIPMKSITVILAYTYIFIS